ncbi:MAG: PAS domain S-box protein [Balneolaceae bacterium]|nr:MAG: PAS domain S-box protein [Balneolaceae bacterium]
MKFTPLRISVIYLIFATVWIATTDQILEWLVDDIILLSQLQTAKGFFYVTMTAVALFLMMKSYEKYIAGSERKLREKEKSLNLALNSGQIATWEYFPETDSYILSNNHNSLFGFREGVNLNIGMVLDVIHEDDIDEFNRLAEKTLKEGVEFFMQYRVVLPDGSTRWLWTKGEPTEVTDSVKKVSGITIDVTKNRELEHQLKIERERLEKLFDRIPVLINIYDKNQNLIMFNKYHQDILGWSYEDVKQSSLLELCYPDPAYRDVIRKDIKKMYKGWKEYEVHTKSGEVRNQLWTNIILSNDTFVGVGYDITERKKLENQIKSEREELQAIFDSMPVFIYVHGDRATVTSVNKYFEEKIGYTNEDAKTGNLLQLITTEEDYNRGKTEISEAEGKWSDFELISKSGKKLYTTWINAKISEDKSIGIGVDITERKNLEESIQKSKERLELTTSSANVGTWEWYPHTGQVEIDEMWAILVGYSKEELEPISIATWNKLVHPDDLLRFKKAVDDYFEGRTEIYEVEVRMKHKKGHWVWILDRGRTVEWGDEGKPVRLAGTHVDITDRVNFEKENQLLAEVFLQSNTGLSVSNHQANKLERVNGAYAELFGYSMDEMEGMSVNRLYSEKWKGDVDRIINELDEFGFTIFESEMMRKDGSTFDALINLTLVTDSDTGRGYRISTVQDISKIKEQQYELLRNQERLLQAQEIARLGYWSLNIETEELWWSDIVYQIYDKDPAQFNPNIENYVELTHADDMDLVEKTISKFIEEKSFELNHRIIKRGGQIGFVQVKGKRIYDEYNNAHIFTGTVLDITEIKMMEYHLQQEQKRFEVAADIISDVIWEWNPEANMLWWGVGIESVLGYSKEEYEGNNRFWHEKIAEEDQQRVINSMETAENDGSTFWSEEYQFYAADGTKKTVVDSATILRDEDGAIIRIIGAMVDKTQELEYRRTLAEQSYKFEMIAKSSNDVLYDWDNKTGHVWWSEGWQLRFGYKDNEIENNVGWWEKNVHPDNLKKVYESLKKSMESGHSSWFEYYQFKNGFGNYSVVIDRGYFLRDDEGNVLNMVGTISDITADVKSKEELKASEEQYRLLFEQNPIPMIIFDPETYRFTAVNDSFSDKYGFSKDEALELDLFAIRPESDIEYVKRDVKKNRGKTSFGEWTHLTKHREKLIVEVSASDIFYKGKIQRLVIAHDITEQRRAEERAISAIIEGEERERQRIAKELHDGLGQYLSAANMNLKSVFEDLPEIPERLYGAYQSGLEFLSHAISETRNISQNLLPKAIQDYGLELAIESLISHLKNSNEIDFYYYNNLGDTEISDKVQINLYRIFQEAINNAIRHGKAKRIDVQLVYSDKELLLTVEDNGVGFDLNDESHFGLGIRSMRTRVAVMAAELDIISNKGRGTIVSVVVPL